MDRRSPKSTRKTASMRRSSGEHVRIIVLTVSAMPFFLFCSEPSRRGLSTNASQANRYMTASTQKLIEHAQKRYQKQIRSDYSTPIPWATAISTVQQWAATGQRCDRLSKGWPTLAGNFEILVGLGPISISTTGFVKYFDH